MSGDGVVVAFSEIGGYLDQGITRVRNTASGTVEDAAPIINGIQPNTNLPRLSQDGRIVTFVSAQPLSNVDVNFHPDVYARVLGDSNAELVSVGSDAQPTERSAASSGQAVSSDGRYVAFWSDSCVLGGTCSLAACCADRVYLRDRLQGTTEQISPQGVDVSVTPVSISADGQLVAYTVQSAACGALTDVTTVVLLWDQASKATQTVSTGQCHDHAWAPALSADGRFVAFGDSGAAFDPSDYGRVCPGESAYYGCRDVFVRDRQSGAVTDVTITPTGGKANGDSESASISGDGRFVAFASRASNLVPSGTNGLENVYVRDVISGVTELVSSGLAGSAANGSSNDPAISGNGRFVAFASDASNLAPNDTDGAADAFLYDRCPDGSCIASTPVLDPTKSTVTVTPTNLAADCASSHATATVTLVDTSGSPYTQPATVTLSSSRGVTDTITGSPVTTSTGTVTFSVCSDTTGMAALSATANGSQLANAASVNFEQMRQVIIVPGIQGLADTDSPCDGPGGGSEQAGGDDHWMSAQAHAETDFGGQPSPGGRTIVDLLLNDSEIAAKVRHFTTADFRYFSYSSNWQADTSYGDCESQQALDVSASLFHEELSTWLAAAPVGTRFDVMAHSLGGAVVARWAAIETNPKLRDAIHSVTTFESPLRGIDKRVLPPTFAIDLIKPLTVLQSPVFAVLASPNLKAKLQPGFDAVPFFNVISSDDCVVNGAIGRGWDVQPYEQIWAVQRQSFGTLADPTANCSDKHLLPKFITSFANAVALLLHTHVDPLQMSSAQGLLRRAIIHDFVDDSSDATFNGQPRLAFSTSTVGLAQWTHVRCNCGIQGSSTDSHQTGDFVEFHFNGPAYVTLWTKKGPTFGTIDTFFDGVYRDSQTVYAAADQTYVSFVYSVDGAGSHDFKVEVGTGFPGTSGLIVGAAIDGFETLSK